VNCDLVGLLSDSIEALPCFHGGQQRVQPLARNVFFESKPRQPRIRQRFCRLEAPGLFAPWFRNLWLSANSYQFCCASARSRAGELLPHRDFFRFHPQAYRLSKLGRSAICSQTIASPDAGGFPKGLCGNGGLGATAPAMSRRPAPAAAVSPSRILRNRFFSPFLRRSRDRVRHQR